MHNQEKTLLQVTTAYDSYQVTDMVYEGRKARILFSADKAAICSGVPLDGGNSLLLDYIQRLFELVAQTRPRQLLMIGGGAYTLPTALVHALPDIKIDVVEIDSELDALAKDFFGFSENKRLKIFHEDGRRYLKNCRTQYDMIIIDAFTNLNIPGSLTGSAAVKSVHDGLVKDGIAAINIISAYRGRNAKKLESFYNEFNNIFSKCHIFPADPAESLWSSQNFILVSQKGDKNIDYGLRYAPLEPLQAGLLNE